MSSECVFKQREGRMWIVHHLYPDNYFDENWQDIVGITFECITGIVIIWVSILHHVTHKACTACHRHHSSYRVNWKINHRQQKMENRPVLVSLTGFLIHFFIGGYLFFHFHFFEWKWRNKYSNSHFLHTAHISYSGSDQSMVLFLIDKLFQTYICLSTLVIILSHLLLSASFIQSNCYPIIIGYLTSGGSLNYRMQEEDRNITFLLWGKLEDWHWVIKQVDAPKT